MKCPHCNNEYPDNFAHCTNCGAQSTAYQKNDSFASQTIVLPRPPYPTSVELIKQVAGSKIYLAAAIFYTIKTAISLLSATTAIASIIPLVYTIAIWMLRSESKKSTAPFEMNLNSLKTMKILKTISLVFTWISAALIIPIISFSAFVGNSIDAYSSDENAVEVAYLSGVIIAILLVVGCFAFPLWMQHAQRRFYKSLLESAEKGTRPESLPYSAPVLMILSSTFTLIIAITFMIVIVVCADIFNDIVGMSYSGAINTLVLIMLSIFIVPSSLSEFLFAIVMLKGRSLADESYFPSEEEVFFYKRQHNAAESAAFAVEQARYEAQYRASYQQNQQQNNFGQQPNNDQENNQL